VGHGNAIPSAEVTALKNHFSAEENFFCAGIDHFFRTMGLPPLRNGVYYGIIFQFYSWNGTLFREKFSVEKINLKIC